MTMSLAQAQAARFNAAYARRNVGGASTKGLNEAFELTAVVEWFNAVYDQIDDRIESAFINGDREKEIMLRQLRAIMRDYEPRSNDTPESVEKRMNDLSTELRRAADSNRLGGTFQDYISKLSGQVKKISLEGVDTGVTSEEDVDSIDTEGPGEIGGKGGEEDFGDEFGDEKIDIDMEADEEEGGGEFPEEEFPVPAESAKTSKKNQLNENKGIYHLR